MSPRPKRQRRLKEPPSVTGFIPDDGDFDSQDIIVLLYEEYEAIKLADYQELSQLEASKIMEVSRPTFTRIYDSARKKIAQAFMEHKHLRIGGGDVVFNEKWYLCNSCESVFKLPPSNKEEHVKCPVCHSDNIIEIQDADINFRKYRGMHGRGRHRDGMGQQPGNCVCPKCNYSVPHVAGVPCNSQLCPTCNIRMVRENSYHHKNIINKRKP